MATEIPLTYAAARLEGLSLNAGQIATLESELPENPGRNLLDLAHAYQWGSHGKIKQHGYAALLLQCLVDQGPAHRHFSDAQYELGWMYLYGLGLRRDYGHARARFTAAAERGHAEAMIELGWLHQFGQGVKRDPAKALAFFRAAGDKGSLHARWLVNTSSYPPQHWSRAWNGKLIEPLTGMRFSRIPAGKFLREPIQAPNQKPFEPHQVTISEPFFMAVHEVTQAQWRRIMGQTSPYFSDCGVHCPMVGINWYQSQAFVQRLNRLSPLEGFRLPTEAEWEYACRAGTPTAYHVGPSLDSENANVDHRFGGERKSEDLYLGSPLNVGTYPANEWRLHDMHGNVLEWCMDDFCEFSGRPQRDPVAHCNSGLKAIRGGS